MLQYDVAFAVARTELQESYSVGRHLQGSWQTVKPGSVITLVN